MSPVCREAYLSFQEQAKLYSFTFRESDWSELEGKEAPKGANFHLFYGVRPHAAYGHPKLSSVRAPRAGLAANRGRGLANRLPGKPLEY